MDFFKCFLKSYWSMVLNGILLVSLFLTTSYFLLQKDETAITDEVSYAEVEEVVDTIYVDVKGAVKKPGVYEVNSASIINDVISKAGGFTSKAYKNNINLSKKVSSEMVIYVYTKTEYKSLNKENEITTCNCDDYYIDSCTNNGSSIITNGEKDSDTIDTAVSDKTNDTKVSLNNATKEELMTLNGVGESKAESIIKYREENSGFKSIEEIKNVSGIGEAAYEKIKDNITL